MQWFAQNERRKKFLGLLAGVAMALTLAAAFLFGYLLSNWILP